MFDRFTDDAKRAFNLARMASQRLRHPYLGTEHILLGLLDLEDPTSRDLLSELGVDREGLRREIHSRVESGPQNVEQGQIPFTPGAKRVLELTMEAGGMLGARELGTEHLLLGLIQEGAGVAAQSLKKYGVTRVSAVAALVKMRGPVDAPFASASRLDEAESEAVLRIAKRVLERRGESAAAKAVEEAISRFGLRS